MTFLQLKTELLKRSAKAEVCSDFPLAFDTSNEIDFIKNFKHLGYWAYASQILDATLIAEFSQANLNSEEIFTIGTHVLSNPKDVLVLENAVVTINLTGNNICNVKHFSTSLITINLDDNSYVDFKSYRNGTFQISAIKNASSKIELINNSSGNIELSNNAVSECHVKNNSQCSVVANNDAICILKTFQTSTAVYTQNDNSFFNLIKSQNSTINGQPL
jgi:hypothetical protein